MSATPRVVDAQVVRIMPHRPLAFTQGLIFNGPTLFESTGLKGNSDIREISALDGELVRYTDVPDEYFAEGIARWHDSIYQLTLDSNIIFKYDVGNLSLIDSYPWSGPGWGMCSGESGFLFTNGSEEIAFCDPVTFVRNECLKVRYGTRLIAGLNDLDIFGDIIIANVWKTNRVAVIHGKTGDVICWIECEELALRQGLKFDHPVMNGIAVDKDNGHIYLTGKHWKEMFVIEMPAILVK